MSTWLIAVLAFVAGYCVGQWAFWLGIRYGWLRTDERGITRYTEEP